MDNVYTSFRPVFLFARILGLFPMSFEGPITKGFLKTKLFGLTCSGLAFSSLSALIFVQIKYNHELDHPTISKVAWYISFDFTMISLLLQFGLQFIKRNEIRKFLTLLNEFDDQVSATEMCPFMVLFQTFYFQAKKLEVQINHKSHKTTALVAIIAIIIISLLTFGLVPLISIMWDIYPDLIAYFSYLTANIYKLFFTYQFTLATLSVRERFKLLNFYLNRTLSRRRRKIFNAESSKNLQMLTRLYLDLCDLVDHVNSTFTFHLIFVVLIAFVSHILLSSVESMTSSRSRSLRSSRDLQSFDCCCHQTMIFSTHNWLRTQPLFYFNIS